MYKNACNLLKFLGVMAPAPILRNAPCNYGTQLEMYRFMYHQIKVSELQFTLEQSYPLQDENSYMNQGIRWRGCQGTPLFDNMPIG